MTKSDFRAASRIALTTVAALSALAGLARAQSFEAEDVLVRNFDGAVEIRTTNGEGIEVALRQGEEFHSVAVREQDGVVTIEGDAAVAGDERGCCGGVIARDVDLAKDRRVSTGPGLDEAWFSERPTLVIEMPIGGDVDILDARITLDMERLDARLGLESCYVYGETEDLGEAAIGLLKGSRLVTGDIAGGVEIDMSGDADLLVGDAAMADVDMAGSGDVILGEIDGMLDVSIAGSGVVRVTRLDGPLTARIAGSGGVAVKEGRADRLRATVDGSGGVYFGGEVRQPDLRLYGSSEVRMRRVSGRVAKVGGGTVYVGDEIFDDE